MKKTVLVRDVKIGGNSPVSIQSMTNTDTRDTLATVRQVEKLYQIGADIVRVSVPNDESLNTIKELSKGKVPIVADIHFDYKLAIKSVESGADKIRINPSNIPQTAIKDIVKCCKERNIPIRVGVNKGSVKENSITPRRLAEIALENAKIIEDLGYDNLVLAVKTSDVIETIKSYRILDKLCGYPLHIGLTEAGTAKRGILKSAVAIGSLLADNIGDTIRVSLTGDPINEIFAAKEILRASGLDKNFVEVVACPTCARNNLEVEKIASTLEEMTKEINKPLRIAVMGCVVNGIGESKDADFGVAGGRDKSAIFAKGEILKTLPNDEVLDELIRLTKEYIK